MNQSKHLAMAIIVLAGCILLGSLWIGYSLQSLSADRFNANAQQEEVMNLDEAATFLKMTSTDLALLVENQAIEHIYIRGQYTFSRLALLEWLGSNRVRVLK